MKNLVLANVFQRGTNKTFMKLNSITCLFGLVMLLLFTGCETVIDDNPSLTVEADSDFTASFGEEIRVSAFAYSNTNESIFYEWEIVAKPQGSNLVLTDFENDFILFTPDEIGEYNFRVTASNGNLTDTDEVKVNVQYAPVVLGNIDSDRTLENIYDDPEIADYRVPGYISVSALLNIEPGVKIIMDENAEINITDQGALSALGSSSQPIVITGSVESPGYWSRISFNSLSVNNKLENVNIHYGGSSEGAIHIGKGKLSMENTMVTESATSGVFMNDKDASFSNFTDNTISDNEVPVKCFVRHFSNFSGSSDFSGNQMDIILGQGNIGLEDNATWQKLNVPYEIPSTINYIDADLTIEAGTKITANQDAGLVLQVDGSMSAIGSVSEPIIFQGNEDLRGYWKGIRFESNTTKNKLHYVNVSNAGSSGFDGAGFLSNIELVGDGRLDMQNTTSSKSGGYGVGIRNTSCSLDNFKNNTLTDNETAFFSTYLQFASLDNTSDFTGNTNDYIQGFQQETVIKDLHWKPLNVPYRLHGAQCYFNADLSIEAGVEIIATPGAGIIIYADGSLEMDGDASNYIWIYGEEDIAGYWLGIQIQSNTPKNFIDYSIIENAAQKDIPGTGPAAIGLIGTLEITNSQIVKSKGYGIFVDTEGTLTYEDLQFSNVELDDIYYE